jgi:hypothetical protein
MACVKGSWQPVVNQQYVYGNFAWTGFDYKGETAMGWPDVSSSYGIHDYAGFPKDGVGYYKVRCSSLSIAAKSGSGITRYGALPSHAAKGGVGYYKVR